MVWKSGLIVIATALASAMAYAGSAAGDQAQRSEAALEEAILEGYRRYNGTCGHCHGPDGVGSSFAPGLIEQPLSFAEFEQVVREGSTSGTSVMQGFADDPNVAPYIRDIYLYLEARAEGAIGRGRPARMP